jgi:peptidyl-tRNA hydrolase
MTNGSPQPYLYILMRTDLASMNPGKAVAQGAHAANQFQTRAKAKDASTDTKRLFDVWASSADGFGTTITLGVNERQMRSAVDYAQRCGFMSGVIHDPTYPLVDGACLHLIPLDTCGWVFGEKAELQWLFTDLSLMA